MKLRILTFWYVTPCHYFPHFLLSNNLYDWFLCITLMSKKMNGYVMIHQEGLGELDAGEITKPPGLASQACGLYSHRATYRDGPSVWLLSCNSQ